MKISVERRELKGYPYQTTKDVIADFILFLYDFYDVFLVDWDNLSNNIKKRLIILYVDRICDKYKEIHSTKKEWYILSLCKYYHCN